MEAFQQRVVDEKTELDEKISKLIAFLDGPIYQTLPVDEMARMNHQVVAMKDYSYTLGQRIEAFK